MCREQRHALTQSALQNSLSQLKVFKTRLRVIDYHPFREKLTILFCLIAHVKQEEERVASMEFFNLSFKGILVIITFVVLIQKLAEQKT